MDLSQFLPRQRLAWARYQAGEAVPIVQLPKNGQHCTEQRIGGSTCGHPLLIDGSCANRAMHGDVTDDDLLVTDAMIEAAYAVLPGWLVHEIESQLMRDAIVAALRARDENQS